MTQVLCLLLTLLFSPGSPAMEGDVDFRHSFLAAKSGQNLLNPGINVTEKGMQHVLERHIVNGIPEFAGKSKFTTGVNLQELIQQGTQMPMVRQANGNFARTFDAGRAIGVNRATGQASSTVTIITGPNGNLVTMFPGAP
jgi:uncharacterized protein YfaP (DUF2135 family)